MLPWMPPTEFADLGWNVSTERRVSGMEAFGETYIELEEKFPQCDLS
jgi:hypothetical protein